MKIYKGGAPKQQPARIHIKQESLRDGTPLLILRFAHGFTHQYHKKTTFQAGDFDCKLKPKINWNMIKGKKWRKLDVLLIGQISLNFPPTPGQLATAKPESPTYRAASSVTAKKEAIENVRLTARRGQERGQTG